jgi:hypothetical protein
MGQVVEPSKCDALSSTPALQKQKKKGAGCGKRQNNGEDEPNPGVLYLCMEMSQQNTLNNHHILIKTFN